MQPLSPLLVFTNTAIGLVILMFLFVCLFAVSWRVAGNYYGHAPLWQRWCSLVLLACWLPIATFSLLAPMHGFRLSLIIPMAGIALVAAVRSGPPMLPRMQADARKFGRRVSSIRRSPLVLLLAILALVIGFMRTVRGLVAPPLVWDALTYHLYKAGKWVQRSGYAPEAAPDAWGYYEYFPQCGEIIWAWLMLPVHGDAFLALGGLFTWAACALAMYGLCRGLGARRQPAFLGALLLIVTPCVGNYITSCHTDILAFTCYLFGCAFLYLTLKQRTLPHAFFSAAGFALAAGIKSSFLLPSLMLLGVLGTICLLARSNWNTRLRFISLIILAGTIMVPGYLRAWQERGSPFYPLPIKLGPLTLSEGNAQLAKTLKFEHRPASIRALTFPNLLQYSRRIMWPEGVLIWKEHLNLGLAGLVVFAAGTMAFIQLLYARRQLRLILLVLAAAAAVASAGLFTPYGAGQRVMWFHTSGRFLLPPYTVLLAALVVTQRTYLLQIAIAVSLPFMIPLGWCLADLQGIGMLIAVLALVTPAALLVRRSIQSTFTRACCLLAVLFCAGGTLGLVRASCRYDIYRSAAEGRAFDVHELFVPLVESWALWKHFDTKPGSVIAVTTRNSINGHNWFRYPFLGSRLQNTVVYVSPMKDGRVPEISPEEKDAKQMSYRDWVDRLDAAHVDAVAAIAPPPVEYYWMGYRSDQFTTTVITGDSLGAAYTFHPEQVR